VQAFEEHLLKTPKEHFPFYFAVIASDLLERRFLVEKILVALKQQLFQGKGPSFEILKMNLEESSLESLKQELLGRDLFASRKCLHLKGLEKASKTLLEPLAKMLLEQREHYVIFEGESSDPKLYEPLKKEMVVIDLTKEKPWDRKNRILNWVEGFIHKHKKSVQKEVLESLYERCQKNLSQMMQEVEKLLCYARQVPVITLSHLELLCGLEIEHPLWNLSEAIVWQDRGCSQAIHKEIDQNAFYLMLGQLRYHYQVGLKIKQLIAARIPHEDISSFFPNLQPKTLTKYYKDTLPLKEHYFTKAIAYLFDYEMKAKSQATDMNILWSDLMAHLDLIKRS
jgi:DNA polymerase III delta subunit